MKSTITRVLGAIGLASAARLRQSTDDSREMEERVRRLEARIEQLRQDTDTWKRRHDDASAKVREWKETAAAAQADAERLRGGAEHAKARSAEWKLRAEALEQEKQNLRARLEDVQQSAIAARDYVMATEAKLDLIEAAIQVLDTRTREAAITRT